MVSDNGHSQTKIGRYVLGERLATTDVGEVFRGADEADGTEVLIKVGHRRASELRVNSKSLTALQQPGTAAIREAFEAPTGEPVLVQEPPPGRPLIDAAASLEGSYRQIAHFIRSAAVTLAQAHAQELSHGDISERTVYVNEDDEPVFSEFGMGLISAESRKYAEAGTHPGTDAAQAWERKVKIDIRADLFGLGALLYFLLSGRRATDKPIAVMSDPAAPKDDIVPIDRAAPEAPPELRAICSQALNTDPIHRYLHAETLIRDIDTYLHGKRSRPYVKIAFIVVGALLAGLFGVWGSIGGGPARILDIQIEAHRKGSPAAEVFALRKAERALAVGDTFQLNAQLSKRAGIMVVYCDPTGSVTELTSEFESETELVTHRLPMGSVTPADWWRVPPPGGTGLLLVIAHDDEPPSLSYLRGVLASAGQPPGSFAAIAWRGKYIRMTVDPQVAAPAKPSDRQRDRTFHSYADELIKALSAEADDVVVGVMYVIGPQ